MPTRNVNLTSHFDRFIEAGVKSGRFSNASEVVREGLRLLEQRQAEDKVRIQWLRRAAREGFDALEQGQYTAIRSDKELDQFLSGIQREVSARVEPEKRRA
jgi:antitoxin ParD1/3/4